MDRAVPGGAVGSTPAEVAWPWSGAGPGSPGPGTRPPLARLPGSLGASGVQGNKCTAARSGTLSICPSVRLRPMQGPWVRGDARSPPAPPRSPFPFPEADGGPGRGARHTLLPPPVPDPATVPRLYPADVVEDPADSHHTPSCWRQCGSPAGQVASLHPVPSSRRSYFWPYEYLVPHLINAGPLQPERTARLLTRQLRPPLPAAILDLGHGKKVPSRVVTQVSGQSLRPQFPPASGAQGTGGRRRGHPAPAPQEPRASGCSAGPESGGPGGLQRG